MACGRLATQPEPEPDSLAFWAWYNRGDERASYGHASWDHAAIDRYACCTATALSDFECRLQKRSSCIASRELATARDLVKASDLFHERDERGTVAETNMLCCTRSGASTAPCSHARWMLTMSRVVALSVFSILSGIPPSGAAVGRH